MSLPPKHHTVCLKCQGSGMTRARRKRGKSPSIAKENGTRKDLSVEKLSRVDPRHSFQSAPRVTCSHCSGTGLVLLKKQYPLTYRDDEPVVAIVGGGIGGAALALALQQRHIKFVLLEKDESMEARTQGYGLTLQQGMRAARRLGILPECYSAASVNYSIYDDNDDAHHRKIRKDDEPVKSELSRTIHRSFDASGTLLGVFGGDTCIDKSVGSSDGVKKRMHNSGHKQNLIIARQALRQLLLEKLNPGSVYWNTTLTGVSVGTEPKNDESNVMHDFLWLHAAGAETLLPHRASLVVGADGIRSQVRSLTVNEDHHNDRCRATAADSDKCNQKVECADGILPLRSCDDSLEYVGVVVILGIVDRSATTDALVAHEDDGVFGTVESLLGNNGIFETVDGETRLYAMPFSKGSEMGKCRQEPQQDMWQLSFPVKSEEAALLLTGRRPTDRHSSETEQWGEKLLEEALRRCGSWHSPVPTMLRATRAHMITGYPLYDRPAPWQRSAAFTVPQTVEKRDHDGRSSRCAASNAEYAANSVREAVTLIGDAAHPMAPFKGQGANQALLDAVCLAQAIYDSELGDDAFERAVVAASSSSASSLAQYGPRSRCSRAAALEGYEREMRCRSAVKMARSRESSKLLHSPAALAQTLRNETRAAAAARTQHNKTGSQSFGQ